MKRRGFFGAFAGLIAAPAAAVFVQKTVEPAAALAVAAPLQGDLMARNGETVYYSVVDFSGPRSARWDD